MLLMNRQIIVFNIDESIVVEPPTDPEWED
jgi:hypothetical protein